ncbi:GATA zinc finger domain-containing protein 10-like [Palaemon carinicauda]|uniref:GATA zinc finger domain-containing protein 10-like n=1 Tax=Palaemon carinicauda TaxID=392227 RepID=UPI0035B63AC6
MEDNPNGVDKQGEPLVLNPVELNSETQPSAVEPPEEHQTDQSEEQNASSSEQQDEEQQSIPQQLQLQQQQEPQPEEEIPLVERSSDLVENLEEKSIEEDPPPYSQLPQNQQESQPLATANQNQPPQRPFEEHQLHHQVQQQLRIQQQLIDQNYQEQYQLRQQQQSPEQSPFRVLQPSRSTPSRDWSQAFHERVHTLHQGRRRTAVRKRCIICCGITGALMMAMGFNFIFLDLQNDEKGLSLVLVIGSVFMVFGVMLVLSCLRLCCMTRMEPSFTPIEDWDQDIVTHDSYNDVSMAYNYHQSLPSYSALPVRQGANYHLISGVSAAPSYGYPDDDRPPSYSEIFKDS